MAIFFDDEESGFHAYIPDGDDEGAQDVRDYLDMLDYNAAHDESVTPPAGAGGDVTLSWRAEVVEAALSEDEKLPPMSDDEFEAYINTPEAHDAMMSVVHEAYAEFDDYDFEDETFEDDGWEGSWNDDEDDDWDDEEVDWEILPQPICHAGNRSDYKEWRHMAVITGARPEIISYHIAPDILIVDGAICQVVGVKVVG